MDKYNKRVQDEGRQAKQTEFWRSYIKEILRKRRVASRECEIRKDDIRYYQGKIKMADEILALPKKILEG